VKKIWAHINTGSYNAFKEKKKMVKKLTEKKNIKGKKLQKRV